MPRGGYRVGAGRKKRLVPLSPVGPSVGLVVVPVQNSTPTVKKPRGRPWPKGISGNPGGRPKGERALLVEQHGNDGRALYEHLNAIRTAVDTPAKLQADITMFLIERLNGKAAQSLAVNAKIDTATTVVHEHHTIHAGKAS